MLSCKYHIMWLLNNGSRVINRSVFIMANVSFWYGKYFVCCFFISKNLPKYGISGWCNLRFTCCFTWCYCSTLTLLNWSISSSSSLFCSTKFLSLYVMTSFRTHSLQTVLKNPFEKVLFSNLNLILRFVEL